MSTVVDSVDTDLDLEIARCKKLLNGVPCFSTGSAESEPKHDALSGKCNKVCDFPVNCDITNFVESSKQGITAKPVMYACPSSNLELSSDASQDYTMGNSKLTVGSTTLLGNYNQSNHFYSEDELSLFVESDLDSLYSMDEFEDKPNNFPEESKIHHSASNPLTKQMPVFENADNKGETSTSSYFDISTEEIPELELSFTEQKMLEDELNRPLTPTKAEEDTLLLYDDSDFDDLYVCDGIQSTDDPTDESVSKFGQTNKDDTKDEKNVQNYHSVCPNHMPTLSGTGVHFRQEVGNQQISNKELKKEWDGSKDNNICARSDFSNQDCFKYMETEASSRHDMKAHTLAGALSIVHDSDPHNSLKLTPNTLSCNLEENSNQDSGFYDTVDGFDHEHSKVEIITIDDEYYPETIVRTASSAGAKIGTKSNNLPIGANRQSEHPVDGFDREHSKVEIITIDDENYPETIVRTASSAGAKIGTESNNLPIGANRQSEHPVDGFDHEHSKVEIITIDDEDYPETIVRTASSADAKIGTKSNNLPIGANRQSEDPESISPSKIVVRTRAFLQSLPKKEEPVMQSSPSTPGQHPKVGSNGTTFEKSIKDKYADETEDIKGWQNMKEMTTDKERYEQVRTFWQSTTIPDPTKNLTYHSYRRRHMKTGDVSARVSKQHKRRATSDLNPKKPKRPKHCAYFISDMIDSVEAEMADKRLSLDQEKDARLTSEISQFQSFMARYPCGNSEYLRDVWTQHSNRLAQINWEHSNMVEKQMEYISERQRKLKDAREEMVQFYRFYKGLHTANPKEDPTYLTDSQDQEITEILRIYDFFYTIYK